MKELDPSVINVVDLDVPQDTLTFTILQQPQHGLLVNGMYDNDITRYRQAVNSHRHYEIPVHSFSMELLKNGKCYSLSHDCLCSLKQLLPYIRTIRKMYLFLLYLVQKLSFVFFYIYI